MKKGLLASYVDGIVDVTQGESYSKILRYFAPEFITSFLLYALPFWLDAYFIGYLESTSAYGTLGATNSIVHFLIKVAEAVSVGTLVLSGRHNGRGDFKQVGRTLSGAFWLTCVMGLAISSVLFFGAHWIYSQYVPAELVPLGVPFLRLRAVGICLMFIFFAMVGFLRGVKNTKAPMYIFMVGTSIFLFFDYALIVGAFGFPRMELLGSALASVIQYVVMFLIACAYLISDEKYRRYGAELFSPFGEPSQFKELIRLSVPMVFDKATMAFAYIWLVGMIKTMGTKGLATFCVVKDMERIALVPAIACAQVITVLVSNDFGAQNWQGIKSNIKKVVFLATLMVFSILLIFSLYPTEFIGCFDKRGEFTSLATRVFPILSVLVFFDVLQLVLSGALRGASNVRVVMFARFAIVLCYFMPVSYLISQLVIQDIALKLMLIYGSFFLGNALMSAVYINRFRGEAWKHL